MVKKAGPSSDRIRRLLRKCTDPEIGIDIVSLGLIYDISVTAADIQIKMTLTSPSCPYAPYFEQQIAKLITSQYPKHQLRQIVTFTPPWTPELIDGRVKQLLFQNL